MYLLFKTGICQCHVKFQGCRWWFNAKLWKPLTLPEKDSIDVVKFDPCVRNLGLRAVCKEFFRDLFPFYAIGGSLRGWETCFPFWWKRSPLTQICWDALKTSLIATIRAVPQLLVKAWQVFKNKVTLQWVLRYWPAKEIRNICWVSTIQRPLLLLFSWCPFFSHCSFFSTTGAFRQNKRQRPRHKSACRPVRK